ncbi:alpha/beta hydrolase family protein [Kitasatospora sp. NPDC052868]|uniref:alpha/beta hydrolase family protein n=1 Tax=Kitasatospora sp. NPDC052868 TaxID=3364060 RepID=UPI0037C88E4C
MPDRSAPDPPAPVAGRRRGRLRRRLATALAAVLVLATCAGAAALWVLTGKLLQPIDDTPLNTRITAATPSTVTVPANQASRAPGVYGLTWQEDGTGQRHSGRLGPVLTQDSRTVTRELTADTVPIAGAKAKITVTLWATDPKQAVSLDYQDVTYPGELGPMPAWFVPGSTRTWVIQVHGLGAGRFAGLATMPKLHELGHPVLDITYRNDPGAPHDPDGTRKFGDTEWRDLDAAVRYAHDHGAAAVVLYGFSMGGGIIETYLQRTTDSSPVRAVVLDAPALDYRAAVHNIVTGLQLPDLVADIETQVLQLRSGVDLDDIDTLAANRRTGGPRQPVLVLHGTDDALIPYTSSAEFAQDWPGIVQLATFPGAGHTAAWNADPLRYENQLADFLRQYA